MKKSVGKIAALMGCSTPRNVFAILALDHRESFLKLLANRGFPDFRRDVVRRLKADILAHLSENASALLLDPDIGLEAALCSGSHTAGKGWILALEQSGYVGEATARQTRLLGGWSAGSAKRIGARGVKLLVYFNPQAPAAGELIRLVEEVSGESERLDLLFFLEIIPYSIDPECKSLASAERTRLVLHAAASFSRLGPDVMKLPFPVNCQEVATRKSWETACREVSDACQTPWTLLSAGVEFDLFEEQAAIALQAGASGVIAGRTIWGEALMPQHADRKSALLGECRKRMKRIRRLCDEHGKPWTDFFDFPEFGDDWYSQIKSL